MSPTVSINLCCYNSEKFLEETLQSIFAQTYKDWELIIINDGSSDATESIIQRHISEGYPIIYHFQENHGLGYSRNEALKRSRGKYIAFIDHDDIWLPQKLENQVKLFDNPRVGLVYGDCESFNDAGDSKLLSAKKRYYRGNCFSNLIVDYFLVMSTVIIRYESLRCLDYWFYESFKMAEEAELFLRIAHSWEIDYIADTCTRRRIHSESITWIKPDLIPDESEKMLDLLSEAIPDFCRDYKCEIAKKKVWIIRWRAMNFWLKGQGSDARKAIATAPFMTIECIGLYILSFFPAHYPLKILYWAKSSVVQPRSNS